MQPSSAMNCDPIIAFFVEGPSVGNAKFSRHFREDPFLAEFSSGCIEFIGVNSAFE